MGQKYKKIKLTQGKWAIVDVEDFEFLNQWKWYYVFSKHTKLGYAVRCFKPKIKAKSWPITFMHHFILGTKPKKGLHADHKNGKTLDNRRRNLRILSFSHSIINRKRKNRWGTGIGRSKNRDGSFAGFVAHITVDGKRHHLGTFKTQRAARLARIKFVKEILGTGSHGI